MKTFKEWCVEVFEENQKTFKCPDCDCKVLDQSRYCLKCQKKVEPKGENSKKEEQVEPKVEALQTEVDATQADA